VAFQLQNTSEREGAEVVQCYVHDCEASVYRPQQELAAFTKVLLAPGESRTIQFTLDNHAFNFYDIGQNNWLIESGRFEIRIASSSRDIRLQQHIELHTETQVSEAARTAMPADDANFALADSMQKFATMLQRTPPAPEPVTPFHANSSIGELHHTWLGRQLRNVLIRKFLGAMGGGSSDSTLNKMFEEMANNLPLRALVLFSRGALNHTHVDLLVCLLNYRFFSMIHIWARHKVQSKTMQ